MCVCMYAHTSIQTMDMNLKYVWAQQHSLSFLGKLGRDGLLSCFYSFLLKFHTLRLCFQCSSMKYELSWSDLKADLTTEAE